MTRVSSSNTKAQILDAYEKLLKDVENRTQENLKETQKRKEAVQKVEEITKTTEVDIIEQINQTKDTFVKALTDLSLSLSQERNKLAKIQEVIKIEEKHLEDLYGIKANADSLATILLVQKEQESTFSKKMEDTRFEWEKEKTLYNQEQKELKEQTEKKRKREEEEYHYTTQQKRKQEEDLYLQKKIKQESELEEQRITFEKTFSERERVIKESENELILLREEKESFAHKIEEAVEKAKLETEERLNIVYKYEKELKEKEVTGLIQLKDHQISSLQAKIKEMEIQLKNAGEKVDISEKTVKDIALKAIENSAKTQIVEREKVRE